ncbi:MAG: hypothetical protein CUN56_01245 [Phototrophicales bacterium]|nr:MAG: hypothetical protein CUN56_01245 [Phototrophicales bacterium]RMG72397.1 MAG: hypothetical protein D6711_13065 [Chloroflexota bacterium]
MTDETPHSVEPIPPEEARAILDAAIRERLGDDWDDEHTGWTLISGHDYMARLNKGRVNIDFYVDLLGNVRVEEKPITPGQDQGRVTAWLILGGSMVLALIIARLAGFL